MEVIVLAGGAGTRLRDVVKDVPKPMADINGKPFLKYLLDYLDKQNFNNIILSVGYKREAIEECFGNRYKNLKIEYCIEETPLGTGGAIKKALEYCKEDYVFVVNGDTFFEVDCSEMYENHKSDNCDITMALKYMRNYDRYGTVVVDKNSRIVKFEEKQVKEEGYINGGIYILARNIFEKYQMQEKFSFEVDFLLKEVNYLNVNAFKSESYFIDIGIPEDYIKIQKDFKLYE